MVLIPVSLVLGPFLHKNRLYGSYGTCTRPIRTAKTFREMLMDEPSVKALMYRGLHFELARQAIVLLPHVSRSGEQEGR